ncbi:MAG: hypothetical protein AAGF14_01710, partial [Pseudomonadota bacterium]
TGFVDSSIVQIIGSLVHDASEGPGGFAIDGGVEFGDAELINPGVGLNTASPNDELRSIVSVCRTQPGALRFSIVNAFGKRELKTALNRRLHGCAVLSDALMPCAAV